MPRKAPEMTKNYQILIKVWSLPPTVSNGFKATSQLQRQISQELESWLKDQGRHPGEWDWLDTNGSEAS